MAELSNPLKQAPVVLEARHFGGNCAECKYFVSVGIIEIEVRASQARLHQLLRQQGWFEDDAVCERAQCGATTHLTWDRTVLGGRA